MATKKQISVSVDEFLTEALSKLSNNLKLDEMVGKDRHEYLLNLGAM